MVSREVFEKTFKLSENLSVNIKRNFLDECSIEKFKFIPINNNAFYHLQMDNDPFFLPKLYAALVHLTGPCDSRYDDYKGSYSFTFILNVHKNGLTSCYLYHLLHYRTYIDFSVYQAVNKDDPRDSRILHEPNDEHFSNKDICYFSNYFCGFSIGYMESSRHAPEPFVKNSDSNLLLFGYFDDEYFFKDYEDYEEYHKEKGIFLERVCSSSKSANSQVIRGSCRYLLQNSNL